MVETDNYRQTWRVDVLKNDPRAEEAVASWGLRVGPERLEVA
eukprot:CAMPEP_0206584132 /NCGR_PEP_ID=MMETSP0325_2-20121206/35529_1 /ASSEMBLY_ACC=CAM_ASM_000347 /TAXON_ID=2866 /ORGANISM="Crypthecodinium cohnii, Strain Seligo" /LENGTH=41 /DNA_ID= /DNA_START= /DNA_END= /DNA_ORIENTATION=